MRIATPVRRRPSAALSLAVFLLAGCQPMTIPAAGLSPDHPDAGTVAEWPLVFRELVFEGVCFGTQACSIRYNDFEFGTDGPTPSAASLPAGAHDEILMGSYGPVPRTTPAARLKWRSKDGTELEAEVDIAGLFKDGLVLHKVPREEIPAGVSIGSTHIVVEVDDRTINVYTRTHVPTKQEQIPGNRYSTHRLDLFKVYSKTY